MSSQQNNQSAESSARIASLMLIVQQDPSSEQFAALVELLRQTGKQAEAKATLLQGLHNPPNMVSARVVLGRVLLETNDFGNAERELITVIKSAPAHLLAHQILAHVYLKQNAFPKANQIADRILRIQPDDATGLAVKKHAAEAAKKPQAPKTLTLAKLYEQQKHYDKALTLYEQLVKEDPSLLPKIHELQGKSKLQTKINKLESLLKSVQAAREKRVTS